MKVCISCLLLVFNKLSGYVKRCVSDWLRPCLVTRLAYLSKPAALAVVVPTEVRCKLEGLRFFLPIFFSRVASSRVVGMSPPADVLISERLSPSCPRV